jgi:hypothetical protein
VQPEAATFRHWQVEVKPLLMSMMAVLYVARDATSRTPQALLSASDQLGAASKHAVRWLPLHRCPFADLDGTLATMAHSYARAAELLAREAKRPAGPDRSVLDHELTALIGVMAVTWSIIRERAEVDAVH